jgi:hypothetical protein
VTYDRFEHYKDVRFNGNGESPIDVYIDKKFLEDLKSFKKVCVDVDNWRRWGRKTSSLVLRKNGKCN